MHSSASGSATRRLRTIGPGRRCARVASSSSSGGRVRVRLHPPEHEAADDRQHGGHQRAGTGDSTWRLARQVGPAGAVLAVDLQQAMLDSTADTVKQHGLANVRFVRSSEKIWKLPPRSIDIVFIAHSYHEFGDPESMMDGVRRSLKPGGRLVIVEYPEGKEARAGVNASQDEFRRNPHCRSSRWGSSSIGCWISCRRSTG